MEHILVDALKNKPIDIALSELDVDLANHYQKNIARWTFQDIPLKWYS